MVLHKMQEKSIKMQNNTCIIRKIVICYLHSTQEKLKGGTRLYEVDTIEIKKKMVEKGYDTIDSLSEASGINRNTLSDVIKGKVFPSSMVMTKLGTALEMDSTDMGSIFFKRKLA